MVELTHEAVQALDAFFRARPASAIRIFMAPAGG